MVLYSLWLCHDLDLNINVFSFVVFCEAQLAFTIKGLFSPELPEKTTAHLSMFVKYFEAKNLRVFFAFLNEKKINVTKNQR